MKFVRILFLIPALLSGPLVVAWALSKEETMYYWFFLAAPVIWYFCLVLWYLFFGWGRFRRRLRNTGFAILIFLLLSGAARLLLRYDGSLSGTSLPRLRWVWQEEKVPVASDALAESKVSETAEPKNELESAAADSTQFLGEGRDGRWEKSAFSFDWETNPPVEIWRRPVGAGWSGFSVIGTKAITQEQIGESESITCLDLLTGERIWRHEDEGIRYLKLTDGVMAGEGPRSTPTIYNDRVYTLGSTGILNCCELETGNLIWTKNVLEDSGHPDEIPKWGKSTSPLIVPEVNIVVVSGTDSPGGTLIAYKLDSGELAWRYKGTGTSFSSPRLLDILGKRQIVSVNGANVTGNDPETGEELWRFDWPGGLPKVCQPKMVGDNRILVSASYGMGTFLFEISKDGDTWETDEVWKSLRLKTKFSSASPLDGYAYGLDEGRLACISLEDGKIQWKGEKYGFGQQLLIEDHLLIQAEEGYVVIGKVSPDEFIETGRLEALDSLSWNTPTLAGRFLLVRNDREAICYLLPEK